MQKHILVTGASRGIGFETALYLCGKGHTVTATARSADKLKVLAEQADELPGSISVVVADLTSESDVEKLAAAIAETGEVHGLINNAGTLSKKPLLDTDISDWKKIMDVNLYAIVRLVKAVHPHMPSGSHILNISSMSGFQGSSKFPGLSAYGAAKAAVIGLSEVLSTELSEDGISVNCLCPGAVQTEMLAEAFPGFDAPVTAGEMGSYIGDFILTGHTFYNGKVLPVALNNPE